MEISSALALPDSPDVPAVLEKLSPEATEYVRLRLDQEMASIDRERERVVQAMNDEILHMKQRLLYTLCGKMQHIASTDEDYMREFRERCPDLYLRFSQKGTRKRMRKKPKLQKSVADLASIDLPMAKSDVMFDMAGRVQADDPSTTCDDDPVVMQTRRGQKWIVRREELPGDMLKLVYCDGSSSLLTQSDIRTLDLSFTPMERWMQDYIGSLLKQ